MRQRITTLRERRAGLIQDVRALSELAASEDRDLSGEERQKYERMDGDIDSLGAEIARLEKDLGREAGTSRSVPHEGREERPGQVENRGPRDGESRLPKGDEYRDAFASLVRNAGRMEMLSGEQRVALNVGTNAQGGFLVPDEFYRTLIESLREYGTIRQHATVLTTGNHGDLLIPKVDANSAAVWLAEAAAFTQSEPIVEQIVLAAFKCGLVARASDEMVEDSAFDVLGFLARQAGQAIATTTEAAYAVGASGSTTTPEGLVVKATAGVTLATGQTTTITSADSIIDLYHSVLDPYRSSAVWLMNDTTVKLVRKLKETTNQYIWQPGLQAGQPDTILGRPLIVDPNIPVPAANARSIVFGDIKRAYTIRDVGTVSVKPLTELYAANGQIGVRTHFRTDGDLVDDLAAKVLVHSAT